MLRVVEVSENDDGLDICRYDEFTCLAVRFALLYNQFAFVAGDPAVRTICSCSLKTPSPLTRERLDNPRVFGSAVNVPDGLHPRVAPAGRFNGTIRLVARTATAGGILPSESPR